MTLASDNIYPKLVLVEGAAPASPAATDFKLYVDSSDHLLKMKNSAGVVTTFGAGLADPLTTRGDIMIRNASNVTARLGIGSSGKVLQSDGTDVSWQTPAGGSPTSVDAVPASPNAADQEFATLTGWTTLGSLDTSDVTSIPDWYTIKKTATGTFQVHGIYRAIPSMPFTMTTKIVHNLSASYMSSGLMLAEASPGKLDLFGAIWTPSSQRVSRTTWTSRTARSGVAFEAGPQHPPYFRIIVASSTDCTYQFSDDGILWTTTQASANPGFTIGAFGVYVTGMDNSVTVESTVMYIRFT